MRDLTVYWHVCFGVILRQLGYNKNYSTDKATNRTLQHLLDTHIVDKF